MEETVFKEKKHEIIIFWVITIIFIMVPLWPIGLRLMMATVCGVLVSFKTWAYIKHPNKVVINESGIHVYSRQFTLSSNTTFWKDSCMVYSWETIRQVYFDWSDNISRRRLYETFVILRNDLGEEALIYFSDTSYNLNRFAEAITYFSGNERCFNEEKTALNRKKCFGFVFSNWAIPVTIGLIIIGLMLYVRL